MGLFSRTNVQMTCASCGWSGVVEVQFEYGNLYNHVYAVGDPIVWGRTQVGDPSERRVVVEGIAVCPKCNTEKLFDIYIEDGRLRAIEPASGKYDYHHGEGNYVIL